MTRIAEAFRVTCPPCLGFVCPCSPHVDFSQEMQQ